ncbi:MAG: RNA methyltransferase [Nocardioidaceae bacterium]|nr:RNA methyltransferase [Nocardioidaceae bacterium]
MTGFPWRTRCRITRRHYLPAYAIVVRVNAYDAQPVITSPANPRVKWLVGLRKRRARDAEGVTVVEGFEELTLALDAGVRPLALYFCPDLVADDTRLSTVERVAAGGIEVVELGKAAFEKASYRESPDGWLAAVPTPGRAVSELAVGPDPLILVCESIEKPGNLGAMLRTAEAAGVDAVIAASPLADWGNPNVIRASKGTVFALPVAAASSTEVAAWLRERHIQIVVASPGADALVTDLDLTCGTAVVVGAEHAGVSAAWLELTDHAARLPMFGRSNSLNVATSAAIVIYEALRQRASTTSTR